MKLLFDQNLSYKLVKRLSDLYTGSEHIRQVGLAEADDAAVWDYAKDNGLGNRLQRRGLSPAEFLVWLAPEGCMAAVGQLHDAGYRGRLAPEPGSNDCLCCTGRGSVPGHRGQKRNNKRVNPYAGKRYGATRLRRWPPAGCLQR